MRYVIGVTAYVNNTTLFYDHWEDGYDFNETNFSNADETYSAATAGGVMNFVSFNVPYTPQATYLNACGVGGGPSIRCVKELLRWQGSYLYRRRCGGNLIDLARVDPDRLCAVVGTLPDQTLPDHLHHPGW